MQSSSATGLVRFFAVQLDATKGSGPLLQNSSLSPSERLQVRQSDSLSQTGGDGYLYGPSRPVASLAYTLSFELALLHSSIGSTSEWTRCQSLREATRTEGDP